MELGGTEHAVKHFHQHEVAAKGEQDVGQAVKEAAQPSDRRGCPHLRSTGALWWLKAASAGTPPAHILLEHALAASGRPTKGDTPNCPRHGGWRCPPCTMQ